VEAPVELPDRADLAIYVVPAHPLLLVYHVMPREPTLILGVPRENDTRAFRSRLVLSWRVKSRHPFQLLNTASL